MKSYLVFNLASGGVLAATLPWSRVKVCFRNWRLDDNSGSRYLAVRITNKGKPQVRWLCSGLDASASENREALDNLKRLRKSAGYSNLKFID